MPGSRRGRRRVRRRALNPTSRSPSPSRDERGPGLACCSEAPALRAVRPPPEGVAMCRWLAYRGEPLQPSTLILDAQHSLVAQSLNSPLGAETVNGDGFGFGWYPIDGGPGAKP